MTVVILLAIWTYFHFWTVRENPENSTRIAVGSVWLSVYPGAITESAASANRDRATENTFRFRSKDTAAKILAFYAPQLRTARFQSYLSQRNATGGMLQAALAGRNTRVVITAQSTTNGSEVLITTLDR